MNFGIVYATDSNTVRRIVVSDDPKYDFAYHVGTGETLLIADKKLGTDVHSARAIVETVTGKKSPEPLVAIVDAQGSVVNMILADPKLDSVEGLALVPAYVGVEVGQTYDVKTDLFTRPSKTIPPGIDKSGNPYSEKTIPSEVVEKPE